MASLVLPSNYAFVALVAAGSMFLNVFQSFTVSKARKAAGVKYPIYMAENSVAEKDPKAYRFNCCQRAHANTLESVPTFLFGLLYSGLYHPRASAILGAFWLVGRVLFTIGYASGQPNRRNSSGGVIHNIGYLGLMLLSTYIAGSKTLNLLL
ncbi:hypothetical protein QFC22_001692 [Naganishia vaughanmartiniae]|uniref:Uncharacterized protein n=1 Tax=Naganishia vaughanmartiniae TaxID=1424756 RepID=A0ACC2XEC5_9TREE|nr:hypothetical protein QFC22_001692 [Naganishia vaughanmartiniae]